MEGTIRELLRTHTWTIFVFLLLYSTATCLAFQSDTSYQSREWNNGLYVKTPEPLIPETSCFYERLIGS